MNVHTLDELVGQDGNISRMREWITHFTEDTKRGPPLFLQGPPGTGKTSSSHMLLRESGFDVIEFNASNVRNKTLVESTVQKILDHRSLLSTPTAIIMDEVDGMSAGDRGGIQQLLSIMTSYKNKEKNVRLPSPMICISNNTVDKKLCEIKKVSWLLEFQHPESSTIESWIADLFTQRGISTTKPIHTYIAEYCQGDMRRLHITMDALFAHISHAKLKKLSLTALKQCMDHMCHKNFSWNMLESTDKIIHSYTSIHDEISVGHTHQALIALLVHENIPERLQLTMAHSPEHKKQARKVKKRKVRSRRDLPWTKPYHSMLLNYQYGDVLDWYIYNCQYWDLSTLATMLKTRYNSFMLQDTMPLHTKKRVEPTKFTTLLSKNAVQYNHYKASCQYETIFGIPRESLIHFFSRFEECNRNESMRAYLKELWDFDSKFIEKCLRWNKMNPFPHKLNRSFFTKPLQSSNES